MQIGYLVQSSSINMINGGKPVWRHQIKHQGEKTEMHPWCLWNQPGPADLCKQHVLLAEGSAPNCLCFLINRKESILLHPNVCAARIAVDSKYKTVITITPQLAAVKSSQQGVCYWRPIYTFFFFLLSICTINFTFTFICTLIYSYFLVLHNASFWLLS